jgi:hypothetical protein
MMCSYVSRYRFKPIEATMRETSLVPGTVYIDGSPCNLPCQSFMAWSRQMLKANQATAKGVIRTSAMTLKKPSGRRLSNCVEPASAGAPPRNKSEDVEATLSATPEPLPRSRAEVAPRNVEGRESPASISPASEPRPVAKSETEKKPDSAGAEERIPQQLVMAALAVAEQITNAKTPRGQPNERRMRPMLARPIYPDLRSRF